MSKTRRGIYPNLNESTYHIEIGGFTYYFSSVVYLNKFTDNARKPIENSQTFDNAWNLIQYTTIEKRGFRVVVEGIEYACQNELIRKLDQVLLQKSDELTKE